jgi:hypothetical protein
MLHLHIVSPRITLGNVSSTVRTGLDFGNRVPRHPKQLRNATRTCRSNIRLHNGSENRFPGLFHIEVNCRDQLNWNDIYKKTDESKIEEYHMVIMSSNALTKGPLLGADLCPPRSRRKCAHSNWSPFSDIGY